jgi:hypothetical protein
LGGGVESNLSIVERDRIVSCCFDDRIAKKLCLAHTQNIESELPSMRSYASWIETMHQG